jgi:hypothetical protein
MVDLALKIKLSRSEATRRLGSRTDSSVIKASITDPNIYIP